MVVVELIIAAAALAAVVYLYYRWSFGYWKRLNVSTLPDTKIPFGNLDNPFLSTCSLPSNFNRFYDEFKKLGVKKHGGVYMFGSPVYVPIDIEIIKCILTKDYFHFNSRGVYTNENQAISEHLFALSGDKWKNMRGKLSPTFTSGKMKTMFDILLKCSDPMIEEVAKYVGTDVNIKDIAVRFATDVIGTCAFGIDCNSYKETDTEFIKYAAKVVKPPLYKVVTDMICFAVPNLAHKMNLKPFQSSVNKFYYNLVKDVTHYRETNNIQRNDFMQLLINMKNGKDISKETIQNFGGEFSMDMMAAQAFVFFIAGFETSSSAMTFCLYELCKNPEIQDKTRKEIIEVLKKHNGKYTYEAIMEMKYLTQVVDETLRKYPSVPILTRRCTATYKIPNSNLVIPEGMLVVIPIRAIHMDPNYYENPEKFDPDRFSEKNKKNRDPYTHLPFGEGPRLCIGMRFGMMQAKLGLAKLLSNYKFTLNNKTKTPLTFENSFLLCVKGNIYLKANKISEREYA